MKSAKKTTYLSRVESGYFSQKWYRRSVSIFGNLLFTGKWMRKAQIIRCLIVEISEGGAVVRVGKSVVPDHAYLVLGRFDVVIGSVVVRREPGAVHLCFVKQLPTDLINRLARLSSPFSTLESLSPMTISEHVNAKPRLSRTPAPPDRQTAKSRHASKHSETL